MSELVKYTEDVSIAHTSSLVEGIYYNANDNTVVFDLNDSLYRYKNVTYEDVKKVAQAPSAGVEFQTFKRKYGPSDYVGRYEEVSFDEVLQIKSDLMVTANIIEGVIKTSGINANILNVPEVKYHKFRVGFVVVKDQGIVSELKHHTLNASSWQDAVAAVNELGDMLDLNFKVKEVTVYLD